ncbi:sigma-54-dependent Fis family transcriptional regulator [Peribacillus butanolivorans]|uniref:Sigma-54-dependent Fis family transcriptional regulator n=1 Tax=Peribacillus butanolivorans TaxID=421767 RepID=A0AAX0RXB0_9BACI|nr:sigma-54 dependent transcriptional regulator [Peribacillus butanolivorans]AXN41346.1 sigma-54-dependent Fis family transcriptional regulator [Peribacillus butanolivorans]PEJ25844.1 sigma-54-dependent Fis family transcriptional regulator [Peribacillus butanolivorans]
MKPHVLVIDDEPAICTALSFALEDDYQVVTTTDSDEGLRHIEQISVDIVLLDLRIGSISGLDILQKIKNRSPNVTVIMMTAYSSIETSIEAIKNGAYYYIEKPINIEELSLLLMRAAEFKQMSNQLETLHEELEKTRGFGNFLGNSKAMQRIFSMIERVKDIDSSVLITGESGTGKELVARNIHTLGRRKNNPMQIVNCAAIPEMLLESELFGYEKGAFSGATQRKEGKCVAADGGILFLDEISEMPLPLQAKLLRVLQEREVTPLGSNTKISLDVRIISAANKNLEQMVMEGKFREDLYFRLNVIPISMPPLRERKEDLPLLMDYFIKKHAKDMNREDKTFTASARRLLLDYHYPGNVRELGNIIEYAVALSNSKNMEDTDLPQYVQEQKLILQSGSPNEDSNSFSIPIGISMKEIEEKVITATLQYCKNHRQKTAQILKISERSLRDKIKLISNGE